MGDQMWRGGGSCEAAGLHRAWRHASPCHRVARFGPSPIFTVSAPCLSLGDNVGCLCPLAQGPRACRRGRVPAHVGRFNGLSPPTAATALFLTGRLECPLGSVACTRGARFSEGASAILAPTGGRLGGGACFIFFAEPVCGGCLGHWQCSKFLGQGGVESAKAPGARHTARWGDTLSLGCPRGSH